MADRLSERALFGIEHALIFGNPVSSSSVKSLAAEVREHRATIERVRKFADDLSTYSAWDSNGPAIGDALRDLVDGDR